VPGGTWSIRERGAATFGLLVCTLALSGACAQGASAYSLAVSNNSNRSDAKPLDGQEYTESDVIFVFVEAQADVKRVRFYLDDTTRSRSPRRVESVAPFDFVETVGNGDAASLPLSALDAGTHTITAEIERIDGSKAVTSGSFTVASSTLRFEDNFNGSSLDVTKWAAYVSAGHARNGLRRASAFSVADGNLVLTAKMVDGQIVSGGMKYREDFAYGRYVFRVRTEVDPTGTMSGVVMTWPKYQRSPEVTETDIYETGAGLNTRTPFRTFVHYGRSNSQQYFVHKADASQWHVMEMDWRAKSLKIYRDGNLVWTITNATYIPDVVHHVSIQLDARYNRKLTRPVRMFMDYIRVYR
jgi:hypothetical protein